MLHPAAPKHCTKRQVPALDASRRLCRDAVVLRGAGLGRGVTEAGHEQPPDEGATFPVRLHGEKA